MEKVFFTVGYSMTRVTCPAEKKHVNAIIRKISTVIYEQWMRRKGQRPRIRQMFINLYRDAQFPSGLLEKVLPKLSPDEYVVVDQRQKPSRDPRLVFDPTLFDKARWYQKEALAAIKEHKRLIVKEPTGCHSPGTKVIMFDGRFRNVEDVRVGDKLLGPDGNARTVLNLFQGYDDLLEVIPTKGDCFDINSSHVLTLVSNSGSDKDEIIDIPYQDWLLKSKTYKHTHKLIRADCLEFGGAEKKELPLESYFLGVLLGDGSIIKGINIETPESELITYIRDIAKKYNLSVRVTNSKGSKSSKYHLGGRGEKNAILDGVKQLQLLGKKSGEKFIPFQYLTASIADRMQLLAGLLDTDGYASDGGYDYITKSDQLSKDILFLCRSLGLAAYSKKCIKGYGGKFRAWYNRIYISGDCTNIPVKVFRRKAISRKINKAWRRVGFRIRPHGYGQYFGFQLSGDGRYLLSDFTITHNSGKTMLAACAINAAGVKTLYIVPTIELLHQTAREFAGIFGRQNIGVIGDGMWAAHPAIVVATVQSLWSRYEDNVFFNTAFDGIGMLILDECHHVNVGNVFENTWFKIANRIPAYWRIGMSATPGEPNDKNRQLLEAATGLLRHETKTMDLVDQGFLVVPKPKFYTCKHERRYKNWVVAKGTGLSANEARNKMIATLALSAALKNKKVLIIVDRVETHGQVLYEMIGSNRSMFVYGNIDSASRLKAKREFESGRIPILIGTIYGEGVNMPKMDVVINAAGGKSSRVAIQRMGRVLRISEGKSEGVLIDFMDEDRGVLLEHSLARFQTYQDEGYEPEVLEYTE